jgi:Ca2+/Na+ antiporter
VTEPTEQFADSAEGGSSASNRWLPADRVELLAYVRTAVYVLGSLLATSLLVVGTVAIIAEIKGTWHWAIHLESTISFMAIAIGALLVVLVPLLVLLVVGRWWIDA